MILHCHPGEAVTWEEFKRFPAPAVALDGYVQGPTRKNPTHASFDHHTGVDRFATRSTCEQVALAIRFGPLSVLADPSRLNVHVHHADEDVSLSVWLLDHQAVIDQPRVRRLIDAVGLLDTTGGCCVPARDPDFLGELAWILAPCQVRGTSVEEMENTIREVGERIDRYLIGTAQRQPIDADYSIVESRGRVAAIVEHGPLARSQLKDAGIDVFVTVWRREGSRRGLTIAKTNPYAPYNFQRAYEELNRLEDPDPGDEWGGSDTIGGSPRNAGTALELSTILDVVERCHEERTATMLIQLPDSAHASSQPLS